MSFYQSGDILFNLLKPVSYYLNDEYVMEKNKSVPFFLNRNIKNNPAPLLYILGDPGYVHVNIIDLIIDLFIKYFLRKSDL